MLHILKCAEPVRQNYGGRLTEMEDSVDVLCDDCNTSLGNGDETVFQIGNIALCSECFKKQALEILGAVETTAGEYADKEKED